MAARLRITAKSQVTLCKELLRHLGVGAGGKVVVDLLPEGRVSLQAVEPTGYITEFIECLRQPGTPVLSIKEIGELAANSWSGGR